MILHRHRRVAVLFICIGALCVLGLAGVGMLAPSRSLSKLAPEAAIFGLIGSMLWNWLMEHRVRTIWRHGVVRDEDGQRLGLHAPRNTVREVGRWVIYAAGGAGLSLGLGSSIGEGRWLVAGLGIVLLGYFSWRRLSTLVRQVVRQSGVCLSEAGVTIDGRLIRWGSVHSVLLRDKIYPVLAVETTVPWWRRPDHSLGFGRVDKDSELYRVLNHYVRHPEHRYLLPLPSTNPLETLAEAVLSTPSHG